MDCYLGIDLGTSSVKAGLYDTEGVCLGSGQANLAKLDGFAPDRHLHDPRQWWDKTVSAVREALVRLKQNYAVRSIACCGFHHVPVFLDAKGEPAMPVLMIHDAELSSFREKLQEDGRLEKLHTATHSLVSSAHLPSITEAVRTLFPRQWAQVRYVLLSKDYLRFRLTGKIATERCDATGTNLISFGQRDWSAELAECIGIDRNWLPTIAESSELAGELLPEAAHELGLQTGIPVVYGGGDSHCALLGLGCVQNTSSAILLGTNCTLRMVFDRPLYDPHVRVWNQHHVVPERWTVSASSLAGGSVVNWARRVLRLDSTIDPGKNDRSQLACEQGLYFLPFLHGERCPFHDSHTSGAFVGLRSHQTAEDLLQAVREGVSFVLKMCWEIICSLIPLEARSLPPPVLSGGGSQDRGWSQLIADVLGQDMDVAVNSFVGCRGAAMLAAIGIGTFADHEEAMRRAKSAVERIEASLVKNKQLSQHYNHFQGLVEQLVASTIQCKQGVQE